MVKKQEAKRLTYGRKWPVGADADRVAVPEHQLVIFVDLHAQEDEPIRTVASRKSVSLRLVAALDGGEGEDHRHRRADEDEGVDGRQVDRQGVGEGGTARASGRCPADSTSARRPSALGEPQAAWPARRAQRRDGAWPEDVEDLLDLVLES